MSLLLLFSGAAVDTITPDDAIHSHTVDAAAVSVTSEITPAETLHGHTVDQASIVAVFIVPADATHAHAADQAVIIKIISPADTLHSWVVDAATVSSPNIISPHECLHATYADASYILGNLIPGDVFLIDMVLPHITLRLLQPTASTAISFAPSVMEVL